MERVCLRLAAHPDDAREQALTTARRIGQELHRDAVPATVSRVVYRPHTGAGTINIPRTQSEFCRNGRRFDGVVERARVRDVRKLNLAVLIDTSTRGKTLAMGKLVALCLLEAYSHPAVDVELLAYSSDTEMLSTPPEIISLEGEGASRLDLAVQVLRRMRWDDRGGLRHLAVVTSGPPTSGEHGMMDDLEVQARANNELRRLLDRDVRVMYLSLAPTNEKRGVHTAGSFAQVVTGAGASSTLINEPSGIPRGLERAMKNLDGTSAIKDVFG